MSPVDDAVPTGAGLKRSGFDELTHFSESMNIILIQLTVHTGIAQDQ